MRKERRKLLLVVLVGVAVMSGLCWLVFRTQEPVYKGKRLSEWMAGYDGPGKAEAVQHIGTNGLPTLLRLLRAHDSELKLKVIGLLQKQHVIKINFIPATRRHQHALLAFRWMGAAASNAVPALIQIYEEKISESSQIATAEALSAIGSAAAAAAPALLRTLADTNANRIMLVEAIQVLDGIRARPDLVVPAMIECLKDSNSVVRESATSVLLRHENYTRPAVPALIESLKDMNPSTRSYAEQVIKRIDPEAADKAGIK